MEKWCDAEPNAAHRALAALSVPVITQNIDGLHQKAGSSSVLELHGNLRTVLCPRCGQTETAASLCGDLRPLYAAENDAGILARTTCACGARRDIDVVLYGDAVRSIDEAIRMVRGCDLLLVVGTSLETYPAAMLPDIARQGGARVMMENQDCVAALGGQSDIKEKA